MTVYGLCDMDSAFDIGVEAVCDIVRACSMRCRKVG